MPALPSSLILSLSCAPALTVPETAGGLPAALADLPDPRARRGVRHRPPVVVTAAVCAVVASYRSYAAIAEWVADAPDTTALALGIAADRRPSEAMIRRLLQAVDPQLLTAAIGVWLAGRATAGTPAGRRAIAVEGKSLRGSRTTDTAARHVMAACDQASSVVLASTDVHGHTNEITRFQPLLDQIGAAKIVLAVCVPLLVGGGGIDSLVHSATAQRRDRSRRGIGVASVCEDRLHDG